MSTLKDQLQSDLTAAMRARDQVGAGTLRMALTAVTTEEVAGTEHRDLTDDDVLKVLTKEAKKRREAATAYTGAGRAELAAKEEAELAVLEGYLPKQLSDEELEAHRPRRGGVLRRHRYAADGPRDEGCQRRRGGARRGWPGRRRRPQGARRLSGRCLGRPGGGPRADRCRVAIAVPQVRCRLGAGGRRRRLPVGGGRRLRRWAARSLVSERVIVAPACRRGAGAAGGVGDDAAGSRRRSSVPADARPAKPGRPS